MFDQDFVLELLIRMPIVLLALTVHEFAHAYAAYRLGDPTAYRLGRCTLNPIRHLDPLGTICLMFAPIGWAKPVPVNPMNFRDPGKGDLITSAAGPLSNVAQALVLALLLRGVDYAFPPNNSGLSEQGELIVDVAWTMLRFGVFINIGLAVFNMLPLYPLDGFHVTMQTIKPESRESFAQTAMYGPFIILGVVMMGRFFEFDLLRRLINPPADFILKYVAGTG